jgi:hypothetical protein
MMSEEKVREEVLRLEVMQNRSDSGFGPLRMTKASVQALRWVLGDDPIAPTGSDAALPPEEEE